MLWRPQPTRSVRRGERIEPQDREEEDRRGHEEEAASQACQGQARQADPKGKQEETLALAASVEAAATSISLARLHSRSSSSPFLAALRGRAID